MAVSSRSMANQEGRGGMAGQSASYDAHAQCYRTATSISVA